MFMILVSWIFQIQYLCLSYLDHIISCIFLRWISENSPTVKSSSSSKSLSEEIQLQQDHFWKHHIYNPETRWWPALYPIHPLSIPLFCPLSTPNPPVSPALSDFFLWETVENLRRNRWKVGFQISFGTKVNGNCFPLCWTNGIFSWYQHPKLRSWHRQLTESRSVKLVKKGWGSCLSRFFVKQKHTVLRFGEKFGTAGWRVR